MLPVADMCCQLHAMMWSTSSRKTFAPCEQQNTSYLDARRSDASQNQGMSIKA